MRATLIPMIALYDLSAVFDRAYFILCTGPLQQRFGVCAGSEAHCLTQCAKFARPRAARNVEGVGLTRSLEKKRSRVLACRG